MNRSKARVSVAMGLGVVLVLGVLALRRGVPEARAAKGHPGGRIDGGVSFGQ